MQGVYKTYVSNAKFVSASSAPHIAFMATCCVELWGLDVGASYQHAFGALRQLALLLRTALSMKAADSYKQVYCWQTVNCLELWAKVRGARHTQAWRQEALATRQRLHAVCSWSYMLPAIMP